MPQWLDDLVLGAVDALYALPRPPPATEKQLRHCKVISHRGEHDNRGTFENTYAAFEPLRDSGIHGIEFDVRWTRDLVPVVFHDEDLRRLFGDNARLCDLEWAQLRERRPEIPALNEFVRRFCDEFHLMVEVKYERYPYPARQSARLAEDLAPALSRGRCTVLSLVPEMFAALPDIPARSTFGIARLNSAEISAEARLSGRGGFCSHYAAMTAADIRKHHAAGQAVGTGFPCSRNVFLREVARDVDYVFTNAARQAERWRLDALAQIPMPGIPGPPG